MYDTEKFVDRLLELVYIKSNPTRLEQYTGVAPAMLCNWRKRRSAPNISTVMRMFKLLEPTADELLWIYQYDN